MTNQQLTEWLIHQITDLKLISWAIL